MVLFDTSTLLEFPQYGIQIPALDAQKIRILEALRRRPLLSNRESQWLIHRFDDITSLDDLMLVHSRDYAEGFFDDRAAQQLQRAFELVNPDGSYNRWDPEVAQRPLEDMIPRLMKMEAGTYRAALIALETGFCYCLGGGSHHGHRDFGHGFCPVNDVAVAIRRLQNHNKVGRIWVIDIDAHKGDGTAALFAEDDTVQTLSIHMARGWPLDGSFPLHHPSYTPSDIDVPIESGEEGVYLQGLEAALDELRKTFVPDLAIVLAGADPWEHDALPSTALLNLTMDQLMARDQLVYDFLQALDVPSAWLTAGGYGEVSWKIYANFITWALERRLSSG